MPVVKLRGLPWSCTVEDIIKFLEPIKIVYKGKNENNFDSSDPSEIEPIPSIYLTANNEGRPSGEAFIELEEDNDVDIALQKSNNLMGQRYIEVFKSNHEQLSKHLEESINRTMNWSDPVVRLRGLPYGCTDSDIRNFFDGLNIGYDGIMMVIDFSGRFNGEAFVQFETMSDAYKGLERHKEKMSNRYIEVFRSTHDEMTYYSSTNKNKSNPSYDNSNRKNFKSFNQNEMYQNRRNKRMNPYSRGDHSNYQANINPKFNSIRNSFSPPQMRYQKNDSYSRSSLATLDIEDNEPYNQFNNNYNSNMREQRSRSPSPYNNHSSYTHQKTEFSIKMRGLPYSCTEDDIKRFFYPIEPIDILFLYGRDNRRSGEAQINFLSHNDACEAMKCDKKFIGNRYIELFLLSGSMSHSQVYNSIAANPVITHKNFTKNSNRYTESSQPNTSFDSFYDNNYNNNNNKNNQHNRNYKRQNFQQNKDNSAFDSRYSNNKKTNHYYGFANKSQNISPSNHNDIQPDTVSGHPATIHSNHHQMNQVTSPRQLMTPLLPISSINSSYQTGYNEMMMNDMAKKAFEAAFNQLHQQHQPNHLQQLPPPAQQNLIKNNFNSHHQTNNRNRQY